MTQVTETTDRQITSPSDEALPAVQDASETQETPEVDASATAFIDTAREKVQLDIEDAPFLQDNPEEDEEDQPATASGATPSKKKAEAEEGEEGEESKPSKKKKIIIIAGASLLLLIVLAVASYFFFAPTTPAPVLQNFITIPTPPDEEQPLFYETTLEPFWIDIQNPNQGAKFLVGKFVLRMESVDIQRELEANIKKIRDAIYYYLSSVSPEFLLSLETREAVRQGIIDIVNPYLVSGRIETIFFDSFLMK